MFFLKLESNSGDLFFIRYIQIVDTYKKRLCIMLKFFVDKNTLLQATTLLQKPNGVIICPTDTIYGLFCDSRNKDAIERICEIKQDDRLGKSSDKKFSVICSDLEQVKNIAVLSEHDLKILKDNLPGPFTFVLKSKNINHTEKENINESIGIRIPDSDIPRQIAKEFDSPLVATSVNISGQEALKKMDEIKREFSDKVDMIIDIGNIGVTNKSASTVVSLLNEKPKILREGDGINKLII